MVIGVPFPDKMDLVHCTLFLLLNVVQNLDILHGTAIWRCSSTKLAVTLTSFFLQYTLPWIQVHPQSGSWHWQEWKRTSHLGLAQEQQFPKAKRAWKDFPIFYNFQPKRNDTHRNRISKWRSNSNCKYLGMLLSI